MNQEEKKAYILKEWKVSSGEKIAEMVRRYARQHWKEI